MKNPLTRTLLALGLFTVLVVPLPLAAHDGHVHPEQVTEGTTFEANEKIEVNGTVNGDFFCVGQDVTISGTVNGDVICAGETIIITGTVDGNVRAAGATVRITGHVTRNVSIAGEELVVEKGAVIDGEFLGASETLEMNGTIGRGARMWGKKLTLGGEVKKGVSADVEELFISPGAVIQEKLLYTSPEQGSISGASKVGSVEWRELHLTSPGAAQNMFGKFLTVQWWKQFAISALGLFLLGFLLMRMAGGVLQRTEMTLRSHSMKALFIGLATLIVTPIAIIILLVSIVGLPVAFLLAFLLFAAISVSKLVVIIFIGQRMSKELFPKHAHTEIIGLIMGVLVSKLIFAIPIIGVTASSTAFLCGLGAIILSFYARPPQHTN